MATDVCSVGGSAQRPHLVGNPVLPPGERHNVNFRWEMFNAFNHTNFGNPNAQIGGANAGRVLGSGAARIMQFGLKLEF